MTVELDTSHSRIVPSLLPLARSPEQKERFRRYLGLGPHEPKRAGNLAIRQRGK
jgi:hypothetical protein